MSKIQFTPKNCYTKRCGALGKKLGMTRIKVDNAMLAVTLISLEDCRVISHIDAESRGYTAVQLGIGTKKSINKAQRVMYEKLDQKPCATVKECRLNSLEDAPAVGSEIKADYFSIGQFIDVVGTSIGKGFAGGMKRHNFKGSGASHGVSLTHRAIGSTGNRTEPGRIFPGKKMPGRLGCDRTTVQNLKVVYVSTEHNVVGVLGSVPGKPNLVVMLRDSVLR